MPPAIVDRLRARPAGDLWAFLLFSHGWTWLWWSANVLGGYDAFGAGLPFTVVGGAGPLLGGVVMAYVTYGRASLADLGDRLVDPRRVPARWAAVAVLLFPALAVVTALATGLRTGRPVPLDLGELAALVADPTALATTVLVLLVVGPLPEEVGWRGYLLDRCQVRWSALSSALFVGLVWAVWHAPLFVMPGYFAAFDFAPEPLPFATNVVLASVLYTWLYDNTARSVLAAVGVHFMENFVGQVVGLPPAAEPVGLAVRVAVVLGVVVWFGPATLRRDGALARPPPRVSPAGRS